VRFAHVISVVVGAGIGGGLRYAIGGWIADRWGGSFPWHTFGINMAGAFLLGVLMVISTERGIVSSEWRLFLGVGLLGGFTTFSTLSYESVALMQSGLYVQGLLNMFGSAAVGLLAAVAGIFVGRAV
jgi:fluoride exporter